jgi:hypothetical protein
MNTELTLDPQFNPQTETQRKPAKEPWNKGKLMGQKPPLKPKEVWEIRIRLQLGHRQQAAGLRSRQAQSQGCRPRRSNIETCDGHATKDPSASAIRNYRSNPYFRFRLDQKCQTQERRFPVPKSNPRFSPYHYPAICQDRRKMGRQHRIKPCRLWNPFIP